MAVSICHRSSFLFTAALILMSAFSSSYDLSRRFYVPAFLIRYPYNNISTVGKYPNPVLIVHGTQDRLIPIKQGRAMAEAAQNGTLLAYETGHNDCPPDYDIFWKDLEKFLKDNKLL